MPPMPENRKYPVPGVKIQNHRDPRKVLQSRTAGPGDPAERKECRFPQAGKPASRRQTQGGCLNYFQSEPKKSREAAMPQSFVQDVSEHVGKDADRAYRERIGWIRRAD
jgi:hypothetical protein